MKAEKIAAEVIPEIAGEIKGASVYKISDYNLNPTVNSILSSISPLNIESYDALGFDCDYALIKYKIPQHHKMIYKIITQMLIRERGYPQSIILHNQTETGVPMQGLLIDLHHGTMLKLGAGNQIFRAWLGLNELGAVQIENIYGKPAIYKHIQTHIQYGVFQGLPYFIPLSFFEITLGFCFSQAVQLKIEGKLEQSYMDIWEDISYCIKHTYLYWDTENQVINNMLEWGEYYKEMAEHPELYIEKRDDIKEAFKYLKSKGKVIFMVTNAHVEYAELTMSYAYGEDWEDLFDFIIYDSKKPFFWMEINSNPFMEVEKTKKMLKGEKYFECLKPSTTYLEGNAQILQNSIQALIGRIPNVLFCGDNFIGDCLLSNQLKNWRSMVILEEMRDEIATIVDSQIVDYKKFAGNFFYEEDQSGEMKITYWVKMIIDTDMFILPDISYLAKLIEHN